MLLPSLCLFWCPEGLLKVLGSTCGGGVVSAELKVSSLGSDEPEAAGEEELSPSGYLIASSSGWFMVTSTEAASSSCTCWCFEISSLEVYAHSGVCSHL